MQADRSHTGRVFGVDHEPIWVRIKPSQVSVVVVFDYDHDVVTNWRSDGERKI